MLKDNSRIVNILGNRFSKDDFISIKILDQKQLDQTDILEINTKISNIHHYFPINRLIGDYTDLAKEIVKANKKSGLRLLVLNSFIFNIDNLPMISEDGYLHIEVGGKVVAEGVANPLEIINCKPNSVVKAISYIAMNDMNSMKVFTGKDFSDVTILSLYDDISYNIRDSRCVLRVYTNSGIRLIETIPIYEGLEHNIFKAFNIPAIYVMGNNDEIIIPYSSIVQRSVNGDYISLHLKSGNTYTVKTTEEYLDKRIKENKDTKLYQNRIIG